MISPRKPPLLLYSYVATEMLAPFLASLLILYSVFFLIRLIPLLEVVLDLHIGLADFVRLFAYISPHMLLYVIPMASMLGMTIGFSRLSHDNDILAFKACGISLNKMLPPVIVIAVMVAALSAFISVRLIPAGHIAMKQLMFQLAKEKIDSGLAAKTYTEALGDLVIYVDRIDPGSQDWHGVYVSDMRDTLVPSITMAKGGRLEADVDDMIVVVVLEDGSTHRTEGADNQTIRFDRYQLRIPLRPPTVIDGDDVTTRDKVSLSQGEMRATAYQLGLHTKHGADYLSEYHQRMVLPVGCFILSLLGLPLGLQARPGRKAIGLPLALFFFILYYIVFTLCQVLAEDRILPVAPAMWFVNVLFFAMTVLIYSRVAREKTVFPDWATGLVVRAYDLGQDRVVRPLLARLRRFLSRHLPQRRREEELEEDAASLLVHADTHNRVFHLPGCEFYNCEHCTIDFRSVTVAEEAGFHPCILCATHLDDEKP